MNSFSIMHFKKQNNQVNKSKTTCISQAKLTLASISPEFMFQGLAHSNREDKAYRADCPMPFYPLLRGVQEGMGWGGRVKKKTKTH